MVLVPDARLGSGQWQAREETDKQAAHRQRHVGEHMLDGR